MRAFHIILIVAGTYALFHVTVQSFRHVFVLLVEPRTSVLDKYEPAERDLAESHTLDSLVARYDEARQRVEVWEQGKSASQIRDQQGDEPYESADRLRTAIETWEDHHRQIRELHFYWWGGFVCLVAGIAGYRRVHPLLGFAFLLIGFAEMIYWTSPAFRGWSSGDEFERLVQWKLLYSLATLALLLAAWRNVILPKCGIAEATIQA
jgi:hypothetical protein